MSRIRLALLAGLAVIGHRDRIRHPRQSPRLAKMPTFWISFKASNPAWHPTIRRACDDGIPFAAPAVRLKSAEGPSAQRPWRRGAGRRDPCCGVLLVSVRRRRLRPRRRLDGGRWAETNQARSSRQQRHHCRRPRARISSDHRRWRHLNVFTVHDHQSRKLHRSCTQSRRIRAVLIGRPPHYQNSANCSPAGTTWRTAATAPAQSMNFASDTNGTPSSWPDRPRREPGGLRCRRPARFLDRPHRRRPDRRAESARPAHRGSARPRRTARPACPASADRPTALRPPLAALRLITCTGSFDRATHNYNENLVVTAYAA
jgi:hypothetical protein